MAIIGGIPHFQTHPPGVELLTIGRWEKPTDESVEIGGLTPSLWFEKRHLKSPFFDHDANSTTEHQGIPSSAEKKWYNFHPSREWGYYWCDGILLLTYCHWAMQCPVADPPPPLCLIQKIQKEILRCVIDVPATVESRQQSDT